MFLQNADGSWNESLLQMMGEGSFEEFRDRQSDAAVQAMERSCLLTLGGIKVLNDKYPGNRKEWKLVVNKAFAYLKAKLG